MLFIASTGPFDREFYQLARAFHVKLRFDAVAVGADGRGADPQPAGNFPPIAPLADEGEYLELPVGKI